VTVLPAAVTAAVPGPAVETAEENAARTRQFEKLAAEMRETLLERRRTAAAAGERDGRPLEAAVAGLVDEQAILLSAAARRRLVAMVLRDTVGLGPLEVLLEDPSVGEVMVNGHEKVYVERDGRIEPTGIRFADEGHLGDMIERILAAAGRRVDELSPMADARLADGSRVNVVIPPLAIDGAVLSIRRFPPERPGLDDLVGNGTLPRTAADLLAATVGERRNLLVSGGTGSGKTTLLNALSGHLGSRERIVTIEDAAELRLAQRHVIRLESRPASVEGRGEVGIRALLKNALRMRPDRIVIGEVRGPEALDLVTALNTGHEGALSTIHANSAADALVRLETLALMADVGLPHAVVRQQVARGLDIVAHVKRTADGRRVLENIAAVEAADGDGYRLATLWNAA